MNLEDGFYDIITKAQNGLNKKVKSEDIDILSRELNLNKNALKKIKENKYNPVEFDFDEEINGLRIIRIQVKFYEGYVNSYLLIKNDKCIIIDTAGNPDKVIEIIKINKMKPLFILLTHGHGDHVDGVSELENWFKIRVNKNDAINFFGHKIKKIKTPGHTGDSVTFSVDKFLFVGDLMFAGSLGSGKFSYKKLLESAEKILEFSDCFIFPGHGSSTSVEQERKNNAFFNKI